MRNLRDQEVYDNELRRQAQIDRENGSAAGGVALGIAIAVLAGAGLAVYAFLNRQPEPARQNTVIERTKEIVPVPQPQAPAVNPPDINITVPNPAPAPQAPANSSTQADSAAPAPSSDAQAPSKKPAPASSPQ